MSESARTARDLTHQNGAPRPPSSCAMNLGAAHSGQDILQLLVALQVPLKNALGHLPSLTSRNRFSVV